MMSKSTYGIIVLVVLCILCIATCFKIDSDLKTSKSKSVSLEKILKTTQDNLKESKKEVSQKNIEIENLKSQIDLLSIQINNTDKQLKLLNTKIDNLNTQLNAINKRTSSLERSTSTLLNRGSDEYRVPPKSVASTTATSYTYNFKATAYDLSYASCGKYPSHPQYGMTATGKRATYRRTIAVDPRVIKLGSTVRITFPPRYAYLNGVYTAEDTGGAVQGNIVDIFLGDFAIKDVGDFGRQNVKVEKL